MHWQGWGVMQTVLCWRWWSNSRMGEIFLFRHVCSAICGCLRSERPRSKCRWMIFIKESSWPACPPNTPSEILLSASVPMNTSMLLIFLTNPLPCSTTSITCFIIIFNYLPLKVYESSIRSPTQSLSKLSIMRFKNVNFYC